MKANTLSLNMTPTERWFIIATVMLVAILEVLDSTIVNVALPSMMSSLGANQDQITWVLTSYVVASAVMIPLTGFISKSIGEKRLLLIDISGFMIFSFLCGMAQSLDMMVTTRILQGAFGAALIPLSQSILRQSFPLEKQGKAMTIWGIGIMVAPVLGPTLGGFIVEHASWRWVFYINTPFCAAALFMAMTFIPKQQGQPQHLDWLGIVLMFTGVGCLQLFLDQGNNKDWFNSHAITLLMTLSILGLGGFILHSLRTSKPAVNLRLLSNRNFAVSTLIFATYCGCVFGMLTLEPMMLETLFNYTALNAGIALAPMGLVSALGMICASLCMGRINVRYILTTGLLLLALGSHLLANMTLSAAIESFYIANMFIGIGLGTMMVPLSIYALATLPRKDITEAAGLYSYGRMLGTSIGVSLLSTLVSRATQKHWNHLGGHITLYNPNFQLWLQQNNTTLQNPNTLSQLGQTLSQQSNFQAYVDAFHLTTYVFLLIIPLAFLIKNVPLREGTPTGAH